MPAPPLPPLPADEPLAWLDGAIMPEREARLPVRDLCVRLGVGAFETVRVENGRAFDLEAHLERLERACGALSIEAPPRPLVSEAAAALLERWGRRSGALRIQRTAGDPPALPPALLLTLEPPRPLPAHARERGVPVAICHGCPTSSLLEHKTTSYGERVLARRKAQAAGAYEGIVLHGDGSVASGAYSNVAWVSGGRLFTPPALIAERETATALNPRVSLIRIGTALSRLRRILQETGLDFEDGWSGPPAVHGDPRFSMYALLAADEAFVCNSLIGVLPIASVDGHALPASPGPVTLRLAALLEAEVRAECGLPPAGDTADGAARGG